MLLKLFTSFQRQIFFINLILILFSPSLKASDFMSDFKSLSPLYTKSPAMYSEMGILMWYYNNKLNQYFKDDDKDGAILKKTLHESMTRYSCLGFLGETYLSTIEKNVFNMSTLCRLLVNSPSKILEVARGFRREAVSVGYAWHILTNCLSAASIDSAVQANIYLELSKVYDQLGKTSYAIKTLQNAKVLSTIAVRTWVGRKQLSKGDRHEGIVALSEVITSAKKEEYLYKAKALLALGKARYRTKDNDDPSHLFLEALKLGEEHGNRRIQALAYLGLIEQKIVVTELGGKDFLLRKVQGIITTEPSRKLKALTYMALGNNIFGSKDSSLQLNYFKCAMIITQQINKPELEAEACINLGRALLHDPTLKPGASRDTRILLFLKALAIARTHENTCLEIKASIELGACHYCDTEHKFFMDWFNSALIIAKKNNDKFLKGLTYLGMAHELKKRPEANQKPIYFQKVLKLGNKLNDSYLKACALIAIGTCLYGITDIKVTKGSCLFQGLKLAQDLGEIDLKIKALIGLGYAGYLSDDGKNPQHWLEEAIRTSESIGHRTLLLRSFNALGAYYKKIGDIPNSLEFYKKVISMERKGSAIYRTAYLSIREISNSFKLQPGKKSAGNSRRGDIKSVTIRLSEGEDSSKRKDLSLISEITDPKRPRPDQTS